MVEQSQLRCWLFLYYLLVLALWSILCLTLSCLGSCSVVGCCSAYPLLILLFSLKELCLSKELGFCSLFYPVHIHIVCWHSLSGLVHCGKACLAFQAPVGQLHSGMACLACDWLPYDGCSSKCVYCKTDCDWLPL